MSGKKRQRELREEQREQRKRSKKQKRRTMIGLQILAVLLVAAAIIYVVYDREMDSKTMGCRMSIYGTDVSWLSVEEAADKVMETFENTEVDFVENGKSVYQTTLGEAGYRLDREMLVSQLQSLKNNREPCLLIFEKRKNSQIEYTLLQEEEKESQMFSSGQFEDNTQREPSVDARIQYNEESGRYEILPHELGTVIHREKLLERARETVAESIREDLLASTIKVTVDEGVYVEPEVAKDQEALTARQEELNGRLDNYPKSTVTYTFGNATEVLDSATIRSWIVMEEDEVFLDEEAVRQYVSQLAENYNTMYVSRYFVTSGGTGIQIDNNEYGYLIDQEGEYQQLLLDLEKGTAVEREPIYSHSAPGRDGDDDLLGNYVEISIDQQYLWLYKNGERITETPVITGKPQGINTKTGEAEDWSTYVGAYPIAYKESPATLSSDIYGYEVEVNYWMPFVLGQGLHDAQWQGSFGGELYKSVGSHGCVNLPLDQAALIFSYVEAGYGVIIY